MTRLPRIGGAGTLGTARALATWLLAFWLTGELADAAPPAAMVYPHTAIQRKEYGLGARSYWLFEPAGPMPESAPVIVFNHGWLAINPGAYGAWIDHLVRTGNVVIFPRYQSDAFTRPADFLPNTLAAVVDALDVLQTAPGHVRPAPDKFALIGHSAGGNLAVQLAAIAAEKKLPRARAVIAMMPGEVQASKEPKLDRIPADTLLVVAVAEDDVIVGDGRGREIFTEASAIPLTHKKFILYRSDFHGIPRLVAHYLAPTAANHDFDTGDALFRGFQMNQAEVNAFDRAGFWRLADSTLQAAFSGRSLDEATSRGELFRHLGYWSDGRAVERPIVGDDLSQIPRVHPTRGVRLIKWTPPEFMFPSLLPPVAESTEPPVRR